MKRIGKMLVIFFILTGVLALAADVVTIKYANWNLGTPEENNVERQMIQAFMDTHPNIKVVIDDSIRVTGTLHLRQRQQRVQCQCLHAYPVPMHSQWLAL